MSTSPSAVMNYASAGINLFAGLASYDVAKAQARITKAQGRIDNQIDQANAAAIIAQGEYNAQVQRNNAIASANQKAFENSVIRANRQLLTQSYENRRAVLINKVRESGAAQLARNPNVSKDVINSIEMEAFYQIADEDLQYTAQMQSMGDQITENDRIASIEKLYGNLQATNTLNAARNNAFYTRLSGRNKMNSANLRAAQMKAQGRADLIGTFASSGASISQGLNT
jgi:hypothetical protein